MDDVAKQRAQRTRKRKRRRLIRSVLLGAIVLCSVYFWIWPTFFADKTPSIAQTPSKDGSPAQQQSATVAENCDGNTPDFDILTPDGTSVDSLGGCVASPPDNENPYYVFLDTVQGINIQVTEQILPAEFATDTEQKLADLAENYNRTITAGGNTTVRLGASSNGDQFLIFAKSNLLVIIKAAGTLNDTQWIEYIDSLK